MTSGVSNAAYQGERTCPYVIRVNDKDGGHFEECKSKAIRRLEDVTPVLLRYRCRRCGGAFQYDISNRLDLNPYAHFTKGKGSFGRRFKKMLAGRKLKGELQ